MMWVIPAATAAVGMYSADQKREQAIKDRQAQAEVARWSPWTGMAPQQVSLGRSALEGGIEGGISGAGFAQGLGDEASADDTPEVAKAAPANLTASPPETNNQLLPMQTSPAQQPGAKTGYMGQDPNDPRFRRNMNYWS
jgi:hypothetical protein